MVKKIDGFQNKYFIEEQYSNLLHVIKSYGAGFRCVICNSKTLQRVPELRSFSKGKVTINNRVEDDVFYINGAF